MKVEKRVLTGSIAGAANFGSIVAVNLLLVPVFLQHWSKEYYGIWLSLMAAQAILQAIDTGHLGYVGNEVIRAAHAAREEFGRVLGSGLVFALGLGLVQVAIVLTVVLFDLLHVLVGAPAATLAEFRGAGWALLILVAGRLFSWGISGLISKAYAPIGAYAAGVWWSVSIRLLQTTMLAVMLWLDGGLVEVAAAYSLSGAAGTALMLYDARKRLIAAGLWTLSVDFQLGWLNFRRSLVMTASNLVDQLGASGLVLLVSRGLSLGTVPVFTTYRTLANTAMQANNIMLVPIETDMVRWQVGGRGRQINDALTIGWFACGGLINLVLVACLPLAPWVYGLWVRHQIAFDPGIFALFIWVVALKNFGSPLSIYLLSNNRMGFQSAATITRNGIALAGGWVGLTYFGLNGLAFALVLAEMGSSVLVALFYVRQELRKLGADFDSKSLGLALAELMLIGLMASGCMWRPSLLPVWTSATAVMLGVLLFVRWHALPEVIKLRLGNMLASMRPAWSRPSP